MKLQLNFQIVRFLNYKQTFSDTLPHFTWQHSFSFDISKLISNPSSHNTYYSKVMK